MTEGEGYSPPKSENVPDLAKQRNVGPSEADIKMTLERDGYWIHVRQGCKYWGGNSNQHVDYIHHNVFNVNQINRFSSLVQRDAIGREKLVLRVIFKDSTYLEFDHGVGEKVIQQFELINVCLKVEI